MATIALPRPVITHRAASGIDSLPGTISLDTLAPPVPNKHIPACPPGSPSHADDHGAEGSGIDAQLAVDGALYGAVGTVSSLLYPPNTYIRLESPPLAIYEIDASQVAEALDYAARQPLPDPSLVFPWLHGLHPQNRLQLAFFASRRRSVRQTPTCLRGMIMVKADGDLLTSRLKGTITGPEFLQTSTSGETQFLDMDPREGFSVRNFQIQPAKAATTSDIIVYGEDEIQVQRIAWEVASAQVQWREKHAAKGWAIPEYNTFICTSPFREFQKKYPEIVAIDPQGEATGNVIDFFLQERREMYSMTRASEISHNVWLGPTPDPTTRDEDAYDLLIECTDLGRLKPSLLQAVAESSSETVEHPYHEFPSSGSILPPTWSHAEADGILETCKWIYHLAHGIHPQSTLPPLNSDGDVVMTGSQTGSGKTPARKVIPRKILIHCADGYTETTMLAVAYHSYSTGQPVPEAWLNLHTVKKRNCFAYSADVALLKAIAPRLLSESPVCVGMSLLEITNLVRNEPKWFAALDGSFPSRVLDYMYLGNLKHADNPELLRAMGIGQILSVGETATWKEEDVELWGIDNVCVVRDVQDNGIDSLTGELERCMAFIDRGRRNGTATLVHCRVGVSRSATICIAEVMRAMNMSFPRAYCFVRARRLNVIIQPHLRFTYELLKWEELLQQRKNGVSKGFKRELEWCDITREIARMNRPYTR
jgi:dual specificity MAP kinase phosphatase